MNLTHVKTNACPVCSETRVVSESVKTSSLDRNEILEHAHGGKWERREFLCGYEVEYVPNYREDEKKSPCRRDPIVAERKAKRQIALDKTLAFIETLEDVDDSYRSTLSTEVYGTRWGL